MSTNGTTVAKSETANEKDSKSSYSNDEKPKLDITHDLGAEEELQHNLGRLVVDPEEAKIEFGEERAARLKKTPDGKMILWPQPYVLAVSNYRTIADLHQQNGRSR